MSTDWDDKPLGYKKPPSWTRFQKGQSGNPRGRPRKQKPITSADTASPSLLDDALRKERERRVRVNDGSGSVDLAMYEVVCRSLTNNAAKGDVRAQREALKLWRELELRDGQREQADQEQKQRVFQYICSLKEQQAGKWAAAAKSGVDPVDPWPHPDDVLIESGTRHWHIRGPYDERDVPYFVYCRAERDALFARLALDLRERKDSEFDRASIGDLWVFWDVRLPKRWQIIDHCEVDLMTLMMARLGALRALVAVQCGRADELRPPSFSGAMDKETYRVVNSAMKPLLQRGGYRSFAEFEKTYHQFGEGMPWPKAS